MNFHHYYYKSRKLSKHKIFSFDLQDGLVLGFSLWGTHRNHEHHIYDFHIFIEKFKTQLWRYDHFMDLYLDMKILNLPFDTFAGKMNAKNHSCRNSDVSDSHESFKAIKSTFGLKL